MERKFHHLVRAVIEHDGHYLLAHAKGAVNTFLPGGHLEPFERLTDSLKRELLEEAGIQAGTFTYLGVLENEFQEKGIHHFEICHVFRLEEHGLNSAQKVQSREAHLEFLWVKPEQFAEQNLLPEPLRELLPKSHDFQAWHAS